MIERKAPHPATRNVREYLGARPKNQLQSLPAGHSTATNKTVLTEPNLDELDLVRGAKYMARKYAKLMNFIKYLSSGNLISTMKEYNRKLTGKFPSYGVPASLFGGLYFLIVGLYSYDERQNYFHALFMEVPLIVQGVIYFIMHPFILYAAMYLLIILFEFMYLVRKGTRYINDNI